MKQVQIILVTIANFVILVIMICTQTAQTLIIATVAITLIKEVSDL